MPEEGPVRILHSLRQATTIFNEQLEIWPISAAG
jgi:hypothetical protein